MVNRIVIMDASSRFPRATKLKDSCDMCSASKVKCDKEKPTCNRCKKLGYPCFYSPARRMGRPHPHRGRSSQGTVFEEQSARRRQSVNRTREEVFQMESNYSSMEQHSPLRHNSHDRVMKNICGSDDELNDNQVSNLVRSGISQDTQMYCPQVDACFSSEPHLTPLNEGLDDVAMFTYDEQISGADGIEGGGSNFNTLSNETNFGADGMLQFCRDAMIRNGQESNTQENLYIRMDTAQTREESRLMPNATSTDFLDALEGNKAGRSHETTTLLQHTSAHRSRSTSTASQFTTMMSCAADSKSHDPASDCATTAMNLLQQLHLTGTKGQPSHKDSDLLDVVSTAIKRVSAIIHCPCSQKSDVGLLIAAVCSSILETYNSALRKSRTNCESTIIRMNDDDDGIRDIGWMEEETCTETGHGDREPTIRVLGELPHIAKLLTQYSRKLTSGDEEAEENAAELLAVLAADLKSRLQSTSSEVANWLTPA